MRDPSGYEVRKKLATILITANCSYMYVPVRRQGMYFSGTVKYMLIAQVPRCTGYLQAASQKVLGISYNNTKSQRNILEARLSWCL